MRAIKLPRIRLPAPGGCLRLGPTSSVRGRIIAGFALLVIILGFGAAGSAWQTRAHRSHLQEAEENAATVSLLEEARDDGSSAIISLQNYIIFGDETAVEIARREMASALDAGIKARSMEEMRGHTPEAAALSEAIAGAAPLSHSIEEAIALRGSGDMQGAVASLGEAMLQMERLQPQFEAALATEREELAAMRSRADSTGQLAFWFAVIGGAAGAVLGLASAIFIARSILRPLSALEAAALAVAGGDLKARAPVEGPRELARLSLSLNRMTESLLDASRRQELEEEREEAYAALRESEERLRTVISGAPVILFALDRHGVYTLLDGKGLEALGLKRGQFVGRSVFDVYRRLPQIQEYARRALGGEAFSATLEADGQVFEAHHSPVFDSAGEVAGFIGVATDVTERKRAEDELAESEARYRTIVEQIPAGTFISALGEKNSAVYVSPQMEKMFGITRADWASDPQWWTKQLHPDDRERVLADFARAMSRDETFISELRMLTRDGGLLWVHAEAKLVRDDSGQPLCVQGIVHDITDRRRAEDELRLQAAALEAAANAIVIADREGVITWVNEAFTAMTGYTREEALGQPFRLLNSGKQPREFYENLWDTILSGRVWSGEMINRRKDGTLYPEHQTVTPIQDENGHVCRLIAIKEDITERRRAEEALRKLNRELEEDRQQIEALNRSLERKVKERTRELRIANKELSSRNRELTDARAQAATDGLTGLPNHRSFQERIRAEVARAQANGNALGLIMMDIDCFKDVNDSLGHQAGDDVLRLLAQIISEAARRDGAHRYGGDEFAVLLPGTAHPEVARTAERLRRAVAKRTDASGARVTISLGAASLSEMAGSAEELIYGADAAMYWAKSAGKNRVGDWSDLVKGMAEGTLPWYLADRRVKAPDVVAALVAALAAKDPVTSAHTERCSWYAARLAEELGLGEEGSSIVRLASLLHDIGKLAVPDEILFKPGPLSEEEWRQMRQHPTAALHVLSQIRSVADATPAILHHHEHFDGSGYPDGLAGEEIPMASRILLVTDAFDAMTTDRPYRRAMPVEAAVEELKRNSGTQFDPVIVRAFLDILSRYGARPLCPGALAAAETGARARSGNGRKGR